MCKKCLWLSNTSCHNHNKLLLKKLTKSFLSSSLPIHHRNWTATNTCKAIPRSIFRNQVRNNRWKNRKILQRRIERVASHWLKLVVIRSRRIQCLSATPIRWSRRCSCSNHTHMTKCTMETTCSPSNKCNSSSSNISTTQWLCISSKWWPRCNSNSLNKCRCLKCRGGCHILNSRLRSSCSKSNNSKYQIRISQWLLRRLRGTKRPDRQMTLPNSHWVIMVPIRITMVIKSLRLFDQLITKAERSPSTQTKSENNQGKTPTCKDKDNRSKIKLSNQ